MIRTLALFSVCTALALAQALPANGSWTIATAAGNPSVVNFEVRIDQPQDHSSWGTDENWSRLQGLSRASVFSSGRSVKFEVVRDAGTLECNGYVANGSGGGTFRYVADPRFPDELARRGVARPSTDEQERMTYSDVSLAFVDTLLQHRYAPPTPKDLIRMADHGVTAQYVDGLEALGYHAASADELVRMVDHGVTPQFAGAMHAMGYHPSGEDLVRLVDHGVTADFTREMIALGYRPTADQLVRLVDHGVTVDFVKHLRANGYSASIDQLIRLRDAGI